MFESELQTYFYITFSCETSRYLQTVTFHPDISTLPRNPRKRSTTASSLISTLCIAEAMATCVQHDSTMLKSFKSFNPKAFRMNLGDLLGFLVEGQSQRWRPKLSDNCAGNFLEMSPDCLQRYWWATGGRGLRLCRRLFVEADTRHTIWFHRNRKIWNCWNSL